MGVALAVRLVYALLVMGDRPPGGDGQMYHLLANVIAEHGRYAQPYPAIFDGELVPTADKPPLYPALLALPSLAGLDTVAAHRVATAFMGAATVGVVGLLGRRVGGERVGLIAAALAAVYPMLFMLDASLRAEALYQLFIALALLCAYRLRDQPTAPRAALLGAAIGLAALTRSEALALLVLLVLPLLWLLPRGRRLRAGLVALAACALLVVPWVVRNWAVFDRPTAPSTQEGGLLAGANNDRVYRGELIGSWTFPRWPASLNPNESRVSAYLRRKAVDYALDHPGRLPAVVGVRLMRQWDVWKPWDAVPYEAAVNDRGRSGQWAGVGMLYALVALAVAGALSLRRRREPLRLLLAPVVMVTLAGALTYGSSRFRVAAEIPLVVLSAVALAALLERRPRRVEPQAEAVPAGARGS